MSTTTDKAERLGAVAVICGMVCGFASLIVAVFAFFSTNWTGAGVSLASAGLAFGLIANAVWRH